MNQALSAAIQAVMPPFIWNAVQHRLGRAGNFPWREFGTVTTCVNSKPLLEGRFASLYAKYQPLDPHVQPGVTRYRYYNVCRLAELCSSVPGDFVCAGISWGVLPRMLFDFVDFASLRKTLHLIDPFEGIVSDGRKSDRYNTDPDYVARQYPKDAPVIIHRERIPLRLPGPLAFVSTDTGNPAADAQALPIFYESLSDGGIFITEQYANNISYYEPVLTRLGVAPIWLPSGQGVIFKR